MTLQNNINVRPLRLPSISLERARLVNALTLRGLAHPLALAGVASVVRWTASVPAFEPELVLRASVNGEPWSIALEKADALLMHPLFSEPGLEAATPRDLPAGLLAAVAEVMTKDLFASLSERLGVPVVLEDVSSGTGEAGPVTAGLLMVWKDRGGSAARGFVRLSAMPGAAVALAAALRTLPRTKTGFLTALADEVPYVLSAVAGDMTLTQAEFAALEAGDVLLPPGWLPAAGKAVLELRAGETTVAAAECGFKDNEITLAAEMSRNKENRMENTDALEVKVTFELESRTMTVGDLKSLEPGYVFRLAGDAGSIVTVLANGRPVARGALVDAGGTVGVQLVEAIPAGGAAK